MKVNEFVLDNVMLVEKEQWQNTRVLFKYMGHYDYYPQDFILAKKCCPDDRNTAAMTTVG